MTKLQRKTQQAWEKENREQMLSMLQEEYLDGELCSLSWSF